jgi:hypothetical protein
LAAVDDTLAVVGAPAVVGALVADVDLAELVVATPGLLATMGAIVEMMLTCMIRLPLMFKKEPTNRGIGRLVETFSYFGSASGPTRASISGGLPKQTLAPKLASKMPRLMRPKISGVRCSAMKAIAKRMPSMPAMAP